MNMTDIKKNPRVRVGVFQRIADADNAVRRLLEAGFDKEQISVICPECSQDAYQQYQRQEPAGSHLPEAVAGGGAIGAVLGGLAAATGVAATGGTGLLIAGPMILGAGGGGIAGGFVGAMLTRGVEKEAADYFDQSLGKGDILVAAECPEGDEPAQRAAEAAFEAAGSDPIALKKG